MPTALDLVGLLEASRQIQSRLHREALIFLQQHAPNKAPQNIEVAATLDNISNENSLCVQLQSFQNQTEPLGNLSVGADAGVGAGVASVGSN